MNSVENDRGPTVLGGDRTPVDANAVARSILWGAAIFTIMLAATCWLTRPLIFQLADSVHDFQDALYTVWALDHNFQIMRSGRWADYWHAPMLHPFDRSLVLADPHLGTALWTFPAYQLSGSAVVAQNVAIIGSFALTGVSCYLLASIVTGRRWLAVAVGLSAMAIPFRQAQLLHLQVLMTQWLPLSVWCVLQYGRRLHSAYVFGFGITAVLTLTSSLYYGLFEFLLLGPLVMVLGARNGWFRPPRVWSWIAAACLVVPLVVWFLYPFHAVYSAERFERSLWDVVNGSAQFEDLAKVTDRHWLLEKLGFRGGGWEYREIALFPGIVLSIGSALSLFWMWRDRRLVAAKRTVGPKQAPPIESFVRVASVAVIIGCLLVVVALTFPWKSVPLRWRVAIGSFCVAVVLVRIAVLGFRRWRSGWLAERGLQFWCWVGLVAFLLLSLGPLIRVQGEPLAVGPYALLYWIAPGFEGMRVPARLCVLFLPLLVLVTAAALDRLTQHFAAAAKYGVLVLVVLLVLSEYAIEPVPWKRLDAAPLAFRWLRENGRPGAVFVLPADTIKRQPSPLYLYYGLEHRRPMLNGFPAFMPAKPERALAIANLFPQDSAIQVLTEHGVAYVIVDQEELERTIEGASQLAVQDVADSHSKLRRVDAASDDRFTLYELVPDHAGQ